MSDGAPPAEDTRPMEDYLPGNGDPRDEGLAPPAESPEPAESAEPAESPEPAEAAATAEALPPPPEDVPLAAEAGPAGDAAPVEELAPIDELAPSNQDDRPSPPTPDDTPPEDPMPEAESAPSPSNGAVTPPSQPGGSGGFLTDVIVDLGFVDRKTVDEAVEEGARSGRAPTTVLLESGSLDEDGISRAIAERHGLDHVDLDRFEIDREVTKLIGRAAARRYRAIPIANDPDGSLVVALADPVNALAVSDIAVMTRSEVRPVVANGVKIDALIEDLPEDLPPRETNGYESAESVGAERESAGPEWLTQEGLGEPGESTEPSFEVSAREPVAPGSIPEELERAQSLLADLASRMSGEDERVARAEQELEGLRGELTEAKGQIERLEARNQELEERGRELEEQKLEELEARGKELEEQSRQFEELRAELEQEKQRVEERTAQLQDQTAKLESEAGELKRERGELQDQNRELEEQKQRFEQKNRVLEQQNRQFEDRLSSLRAETTDLLEVCQRVAGLLADREPATAAAETVSATEE